ncbi:hypothetical protein [Sutcliffiella horikoshii]|uniref:hypothetical protein n=1 Tax=Sutcliffiella horikoshii TaxID=79883 RepID=UPI001CC1993A|nr:hypothetical protein [Sutcliffiella horikoshii]UAL49299.1 hypothetical protein K7887_10340 [Sutcliffiella horikoshii]
MDAIQLGPLLLKKSYLVLLFSCLLAYLYIAIYLRKKPEIVKTVENHITTGLLIWILIFKFSIIIFRPSIIWTNPYGLLFFTGGTRGFYLAVFVTISYLFWKLHQSNIHIRTSAIILIPSIIIIISSYYGIMAIL